MPRYQTPDGNLIVADQDFIDQNYPGSILVSSYDSDKAERPVSIKPPPITKLEYMGRFTDDELIAIYTAAKTNVAIEVWLEKFKLASEIDLQDQRTIDGLTALEAAGILVSGRVSEILGENL